jgi:hypothetical protein
VGVKKDYVTAYKVLLKLEFEKNLEYYGELRNEIYNEDGEPTKESKYRQLYSKLDSLTEITDEFLSEWQEAREESLGPSEFGIMSSGYRGKVERCDIE